MKFSNIFVSSIMAVAVAGKFGLAYAQSNTPAKPGSTMQSGGEVTPDPKSTRSQNRDSSGAKNPGPPSNTGPGSTMQSGGENTPNPKSTRADKLDSSGAKNTDKGPLPVAAGNTQQSGGEVTPNPIFTRIDGKMMMIKDGKTMVMDKDMMMSNGNKFMMDGKVIMKDGKSMTLKNGDSMDMNGMMKK